MVYRGIIKDSLFLFFKLLIIIYFHTHPHIIKIFVCGVVESPRPPLTPVNHSGDNDSSSPVCRHSIHFNMFLYIIGRSFRCSSVPWPLPVGDPFSGEAHW